MRFFTISQYFNKLQSILFFLLLIPLLIFIALYLYADHNPLEPDTVVYFVAIPLAVLLGWVVGIARFNKKIKSARIAQGLGAKLDKFFGLTIVRFAFLAASGLMLALGFLLTGSDLFPGMYLVALVLGATMWPTPARVCRHLRLRGDEREMVYFRKDSF